MTAFNENYNLLVYASLTQNYEFANHVRYAVFKNIKAPIFQPLVKWVPVGSGTVVNIHGYR